MAIVLALTKLYDDVVARFSAEGTAVPNLFGWRASAQQLTTGTRIVWIPGDPNGSVGNHLPARNPGRDPRPIATLDELFTVEISASDASDLESERKQYEATRLVYDTWFRAVYLAAYGTFKVLSDEWVTEKKERRYGACIRAVCSVQSMIPDAPATFAPTVTDGARAEIEVDELDYEETMQTAPAP